MTEKSPTTATTAIKPSLNTDKSGLLNRKCECHNAAGLTGECSQCQSKRLTQPSKSGASNSAPILHDWIQTKLKVGQPNDPYEQEADRIADQILQAPVSRIQRFEVNDASELLQSKSGAAQTPTVSPELQTQITALRSGGQPLESHDRAFFETRLDADFSQVRIHHDAQAAATARALQARAYTIGQDIVFGAGQYGPHTNDGKRLLAHELTHVIQQGGASARSRPTSEVIQRAGDPSAIPPGLPCPTDLTTTIPTGTSLLFSIGGATLTPAHTTLLAAFVTAWTAGGGTDDVTVHGYASTVGAQDANWTLSCNRATAVQAELIRLGIPAVRISVAAHGESTEFGSTAANQRAVVASRAGGVIPTPLISGLVTARDNFAGRSPTRFGVGEIIDLGFVSLPPRPAADFGGLRWVQVSGGGTLSAVTNAGTATYTAGAVTDTVQLELRVDSGATAGRVISTHTLTIVPPNGVRLVAVPGTAPSFSFTGPIPAGTWGAGFQANVFIDPKDVSFQNVVFGEGTVPSVVTPAGGFQGSFVHPVNTFTAAVPAHPGNATTGTPVSPPVDNIISERKLPSSIVLGVPVCGASDFLWAIPWEYSVAGSPRTRFATANHHATSSLLCEARIEKAGAGPFCRRIDGTTC